ncbi:MAG: recombinase family protein, partial [candidate division NC10 bacterium]
MRVIGYVRVSTNEQAETGVSLAAQEHKIRGYCDLNGWECVKVIRDDGFSAKDLRRPGLKCILDELPRKERGFEGIVVTKLDRLTRSVRDLVRLTDLADKHKVVLVSIGESVDTGTATGQDSTDPETVAAVMGRSRAACMWTDPPYGVDYVGKTADALRIENDGEDELPALLANVFT